MNMCGHNTNNLREAVRLFVCMSEILGFEGLMSTYVLWTDRCDCPRNFEQGFPSNFNMSSLFIMYLM